MKKYSMTLIVVALLLTSCAAAPIQDSAAEIFSVEGDLPAIVQEEGKPQENENQQGAGYKTRDLELDEAEISGIVFMREEEKLARDVYLSMAEQWGMGIFSNIASSESAHMAAVLNLITAAGLEDPVQEKAQGEFLNLDLQGLHDDLIDQGNQSLADALLVGAAIEEIDILDLQKYLQETDNSDLAAVYQNLLSGSIKHLQAFVRSYENQTGEEYQPQYLTEEALQDLLASSSSPGKGGGQGRSGQPRGQG